MASTRIMPGRLILGAALAFVPLVAAHASDPKWTVPTPEELSLTSIPEVPGAGAVILYKEEITSEDSTSFYIRIKILTDSGKDFANVELPYSNGFWDSTNYHDIAGRTIHRDGTVIPYTGKPYDKLVEKNEGTKYKVMILSLPSAEVGSILEYRFKISGDESSPDWFIQGKTFIHSAHYSWAPPGDAPIVWTPILPPGVKVQEITKGGHRLVLDIQNVPPLPSDEMMPPLGSLSYRVLFYFSRITNVEEFWKLEGEFWAPARDKFIGPGKGVRAAVAAMVAPTDTDEQKLHKFYNAIMTMENIQFSRRLTEREAKAQGLKDPTSTDDILARKRGTDDELTELFVAMARAAGMKAYLMDVTDRSERLFVPSYLNFRQLKDYIAIVNVNGVDEWFDPGERYCPFAHLSWFHGGTRGLRETDSGTAIVSTPISPFADNRIQRVADLTLDEHGNATGTVTLSFSGDPARSWRQAALLGDETSLKSDLRASLEAMLPSGMDIVVTSTGDLTDADKPLRIGFDVRGSIGSSTGKRLLIPANLFESSAKPKFPNEKREVAVDMRYGSITQDAVGYKFPASLSIESSPTPAREELKGEAAFVTSSAIRQDGIVMHRDISIGHFIYPVSEYPQLREFYKKLEARDQEALVFTHVEAKPSSASAENIKNPLQ